MKIIVLVKQVPDMDTVKFDQERGVVDRKSASTEVNPFDLNALEMAVEIKEKIEAKVIALSMGPPSAEAVLREAIARGADEAYLLSDRFFGGSDVKATAKTLAAAIKLIGEFDLVITGLQTVDGDTGQVGPEISGYLGLDHVYSVCKMEDVSKEKIVLHTELWDSIFVKEASFPLVISVTREANEARMASFASKMKAKKAEIKKLGFAEIQEFISREELGKKGSPTWVRRIIVPKAEERCGKLVRETAPKAAQSILEYLEQERMVEGKK